MVVVLAFGFNTKIDMGVDTHWCPCTPVNSVWVRTHIGVGPPVKLSLLLLSCCCCIFVALVFLCHHAPPLGTLPLGIPIMIDLVPLTDFSLCCCCFLTCRLRTSSCCLLSELMRVSYGLLLVLLLFVWSCAASGNSATGTSCHDRPCCCCVRSCHRSFVFSFFFTCLLRTSSVSWMTTRLLCQYALAAPKTRSLTLTSLSKPMELPR